MVSGVTENGSKNAPKSRTIENSAVEKSKLQNFLRSLHAHQGTDLIAIQQLLQVAFLVHIEYDDRQVVFFAKRESGHVHYIQVFFENFLEGNVGVAGRSRVFFRIGGINTIYAGTF